MTISTGIGTPSSQSNKYRTNTPVFMSKDRARRHAERTRAFAARFRAAALCGFIALGSPHKSRRNAVSWNHLERAPGSPSCVIPTFCYSHTMMEVARRGWLIAPARARIVEPHRSSIRRHAIAIPRRRESRRVLRQHRKDRDGREVACRMSPAATGGWIANLSAARRISRKPA